MANDFFYLFLIMLGIILFKKSRIFKYYVKFLTFLLLSLFSGSVFIPLMFFKPRDYRNALFPAWGARMTAKLLGVKFTIRGKKNIVQDEGTILLVNHQSFIDLFVLAQIWPVFERCTVISKKEIFFLWPFGLAAWLWGTVFINRSSRKDAQKAVNIVAETINTKKAKIVFFPEGTRHGGEKLLPFKKGAFHLAIGSQAPIQPIVVSRYHKFYDAKNFRFDEGSVVMSILPAISTEGLKSEDIPSLMDKAYEAMSKEYETLNSEL